MIRGFYIWYYVSPETNISFKELNKAVKKSKTLIPTFRQPNLGNVFRRICGEANSDPEIKYSLKSLPFDKHEVRWEATSEDSGMVGIISIDKKEFTVTADEGFESLLEHVNNRLEEIGEMIHDQPIREGLRKAIENGLGGTPMKPSGGVYFVPKSQEAELDNLLAFQDALGESFVTSVTAHDDADDAILKALDYRLMDTLYNEALEKVLALEALGATSTVIPASQVIELEKEVQRAIAKCDEYASIDKHYEDFFSKDSSRTAFEDLSDRLNNI